MIPPKLTDKSFNKAKEYCKKYFRGKTPEEIDREKERIKGHINQAGKMQDEFIYISSRELSIGGNFFFAESLKGETRNLASAYRVIAQEETDYRIYPFHPDPHNKRFFKAKIERKSGALEEIVD